MYYHGAFVGACENNLWIYEIVFHLVLIFMWNINQAWYTWHDN